MANVTRGRTSTVMLILAYRKYVLIDGKVYFRVYKINYFKKKNQRYADWTCKMIIRIIYSNYYYYYYCIDSHLVRTVLRPCIGNCFYKIIIDIAEFFKSTFYYISINIQLALRYPISRQRPHVGKLQRDDGFVFVSSRLHAQK